MIDVKGLRKKYEGLEVLKGVDLTINKGDVVCLVGPSGCGKSTFLRCLNRLEEPDAGTITLDGQEVTEKDIDAMRARMGMVFQHFNLFPHLTVQAQHHAGPGAPQAHDPGRSRRQGHGTARAHRPGR